MTKDFDDTNCKQEILGSLEFKQSKEYLLWVSLHQMEEVERIWQVWSKRKYRANAIIIKRVFEENQIKIIAKVRYVDFQKRSHTVEVQIAMRYKRIENLSAHLQSNFHKKECHC